MKKSQERHEKLYVLIVLLDGNHGILYTVLSLEPGTDTGLRMTGRSDTLESGKRKEEDETKR